MAKRNIKKLALTPKLNFNKLIPKELESEHVNYHLKRLVTIGLVTKEKDLYTLTDKGKNYVGKLDDDIKIVEKQPKSSVLLHIVNKNSKGEIEYLVCKRLRQPYFGKIGKLTGKIRFGETLEQASARELYEETGLSAKTIILEEIYHKIRKREGGTVVQDNIFYIMFVKDLTGSLVTKQPYQENFWITKKQALKDKALDFFDSITFAERLEPKILSYREDVGIAEGY